MLHVSYISVNLGWGNPELLKSDDILPLPCGLGNFLIKATDLTNNPTTIGVKVNIC